MVHIKFAVVLSLQFEKPFHKSAGVTNAGIHARPARENIFSKHVAHVLNDETQRKYIQGLKRLLTKSQQYYPTDPSRSIDYVKKDQPDEEDEEQEEGADVKPDKS